MINIVVKCGKLTKHGLWMVFAYFAYATVAAVANTEAQMASAKPQVKSHL